MSAGNDNPQSLMLTPNDIVGVIRQGLGELQGYLSQPLNAIDAAVCVAYMDRMAGFANHLLSVQQSMLKSAADAKAEAPPVRKN